MTKRMYSTSKEKLQKLPEILVGILRQPINGKKLVIPEKSQTTVIVNAMWFWLTRFMKNGYAIVR